MRGFVMNRSNRNWLLAVIVLAALVALIWFTLTPESAPKRPAPANAADHAGAANQPAPMISQAPPTKPPTENPADSPTASTADNAPRVPAPAPTPPAPQPETAPPAEPEEHVFSAVVNGTVEESNGTLIQGAMVLFSWVARHADTPVPLEGNTSGRGLRRQGSLDPPPLTDEAGAFRISIKVKLSKPIEALDLYLQAEGRDGTRNSRIRVTLANGENRQHLRLVLPATGALAGRVVDSQGKPLAGATVVAASMGEESNQESDGSKAGGNRTPHTTDAEGRFLITGLFPDEHTLVVTCPGYAYTEFRDGTTVQPGRTIDVGDVGLKPVTSIKVRLVSSKFKVSDIRVKATFADLDDKFISNAEASSDANGNVILGPAPLNAATVWLKVNGFKTTRLSCTIIADRHNDLGEATVEISELTDD